MNNQQNDKKHKAVHIKKLGTQWKLAALLLPFIVAALALMSVPLIKNKVTINYPVSNSYRAGDVALFVAMPVLNAIVK